MDNILVIHSSRREGIQVIPDRMDDVLKLLDMYAHENHKKHIKNFLNIGVKIDPFNASWLWYIDLRDIISDIRNKKINELI
jgi:hypothetical protein